MARTPDGPTGGQMSEVARSHVRNTDLFTLTLDRDPLLRSTIVAVVLFDRTPDWEVLVDRVDRATRLVPMFRQRLAPGVPGLFPPGLVTDPDFDLGFHLRRVVAPAPPTMATVLDLARR